MLAAQKMRPVVPHHRAAVESSTKVFGSFPAGETREKKDLVYVDAEGVMKVRMALLSLAESHALFRSPGHALCTRQHLKLCAPICALHLQSSKPVDAKLRIPYVLLFCQLFHALNPALQSSKPVDEQLSHTIIAHLRDQVYNQPMH